MQYLENRPEILLPVGTLEMAKAAIHNGGDAIYVGMPGFNARGRAKDFSLNELEEIINECHLYGVKVHVAFNILIFENEIEIAIEMLKKVIPLGVDAFIVQDLGLVKVIKSICPDQVVHGSTQMTVTNQDAIESLDDLDIKRFVLGRENSIPEIEIIRSHTEKELEVFVHGALCVAYSGQCLTSEAIGGRSANRGQCAQSCRFSYEMKVDGKLVDLGNKKYLVSPQDLCGIDQVGKLKEIGVDSFKIEGRLKTPTYVATTAQSYRAAIDTGAKVDTANMELSFSRGFFKGWLEGVSHQNLVDGSYSSNRGIELGEIDQVRKNVFTVNTNKNLKNGDGLLIAKSQFETGGQIYKVKNISKSALEITLQKDLDLSDFKGAKVYQNFDPNLTKEISKTYNQKELLKRVPIKVKISAKLDHPLELSIEDSEHIVSVKSDFKIQLAKKAPLKELKSHFETFGDSPFIASSIEVIGDDSPLFIPEKEIKLLKRKAANSLKRLRMKPPSKTISEYQKELKVKKENHEGLKLNILVRDFHQVQTLIDNKEIINHNCLGEVILDFEFGKDFSVAVNLLGEVGVRSCIATTRVLKPKEYHNLNNILRAKPDSILVRNLGALNYLKSKVNCPRLKGDFSLNISNSISADYISDKGLNSIVPSYDLNSSQLLDLLNTSDKNFEVTLHHYIPGFHMEHCVYAAFLSKGNSFKDCGKPCEKHSIELIDQFGNAHFLHADQECRNTMFNANAQSLSLLLPEVLEAGVRQFRFEALKENDNKFINKVLSYLNFLSSDIDAEKLNTQVGQNEKYGIDTSKILRKDSYKDKKK